MLDEQVDFIANIVAPEKRVAWKIPVGAVLEPFRYQQRLEQRAARRSSTRV